MHTLFKRLCSNSHILIAPVLLFLLSTCTSTSIIQIKRGPLTSPIEGKMLIVGSVLTARLDSLWAPHGYEVIVTAEIVTGQESVRKTFVIQTDENGYYAAENLPIGKYVLQGVIRHARLRSVLLWKAMKSPHERWGQRRDPSIIPSPTGNLYPWSPVMNVYNFGHTVFIDPRFNTPAQNLAEFADENFGTPYNYSRPPVVQYFIQKYPESEWVPILKQLLPPG